ncbi:MAG: hypothetical protein H6625_07190 [Bdellovibrionaceae bacterium]|nr:hypothetical protein [Pseudobdellovibrionaceae bacterium]
MIFLSIKIPEFGGDFFWHLRIGLDWINKGISPFVDHYSISHYGERYAHLPPYLFQAFIAFIYNSFGLELTSIIYKSMIVSLSCILVLVFSRKNHIPFEYSFLCMVMILYTIAWRLVPRPELFSYVFIILFIFVIESLRIKMSFYLLALLFFFQFLWINIHASPFGFVFFGSYIIEKIFLAPRNKYFFKNISGWAFLGFSFLLIGFLNPLYSHPLAIVFNFSKSWSHLITEHRSEYLINEYYLTFFSLTILTMYTILKTKRWYALIVSVVFLIQAYSFNKLYPFLFVANSIFLLLSLNEISYLDKFLVKEIKFRKVYFLFLGLTILSQFIYVLNYNKENRDYKELAVHMPVEAMDFLIDKGIKKGKIYNNYNAGGYVIYRMPEGMRNSIDGRTNLLYSASEMYNSVLSTVAPSVLYDFDKKTSFDYAITYYNHLYDGSFETLLRSGVFSLEFAGKYSAFLSKKDNKYKAARLAIIEPGCLDEGWKQKIEEELVLANKTHKFDDLLPSILRFFNSYFKAKDKPFYIISNNMDTIHSIFELRAMSVLLERHNKLNTAIKMYQLVPANLLTARDSIYLLELIVKSKNLEEYKNITLQHIERIYSDYYYLSNREKSILSNVLSKFKDDKNISENKYLIKMTQNLTVDLENYRISTKTEEVFKYRCDKDSELVFTSEEAS